MAGSRSEDGYIGQRVYALGIVDRQGTIDDEAVDTIFRVHVVTVSLAVKSFNLVRNKSDTTCMDLKQGCLAIDRENISLNLQCSSPVWRTQE